MAADPQQPCEVLAFPSLDREKTRRVVVETGLELADPPSQEVLVVFEKDRALRIRLRQDEANGRWKADARSGSRTALHLVLRAGQGRHGGYRTEVVSPTSRGLGRTDRHGRLVVRHAVRRQGPREAEEDAAFRGRRGHGGPCREPPSSASTPRSAMPNSFRPIPSWTMPCVCVSPRRQIPCRRPSRGLPTSGTRSFRCRRCQAVMRREIDANRQRELAALRSELLASAEQEIEKELEDKREVVDLLDRDIEGPQGQGRRAAAGTARHSRGSGTSSEHSSQATPVDWSRPWDVPPRHSVERPT